MNNSAKMPHPAALIWCILLVLAACTVATAFRTRDCFVDDAFTGFQYLKNLLAGNGFTFDRAIPPVEGVTNIGWLLALAPFCTFSDVQTVAKLAGLMLVLFNLLLTACLGWRLAVKIVRPEDASGLMLPPVLLLATSFEFVYFSTAGMETGLLAAILLLFVLIVLHRPRSWWLPVLAAYAFLVHPEAVVVYPLYVAIRGDWRNERARLLLFFALIAGASAARFAYFGDFVPNTFHSKPGGIALAIQNGYAFLMGKNCNVAFPLNGWLALPVLLLGYAAVRRKERAAADMLAAVCIVGIAFAVYSPADWTSMPRYFAPYLPAALILYWFGVCQALRLATLVGLGGKAMQFATAGVALMLALTSIVDCQNKLARLDEFPGYVLAGRNLVEPAQWIRDHLPPDSTIAARRIGVLAYLSNQRVFDYAYGLPDPEVSRLVARHGRHFDLPNEPELADLWKSRSPDYILEDSILIDLMVLKSEGRRENFSVHGIPYRVIERFPIGFDAEWVLAQRVGTK